MVKRHNNQLPENLPQLQNLTKRDPASYKDEFLQQQRHYQSLITLFNLQPNEYNKELDDLVMFMAHVAQCYPEELKDFAQELLNLLKAHSSSIDPVMRMTFCRALILLRNKNLLTPTDLLSQFFQLLRSRDKNLRQFLETHIITDIKNINAKHKNAKLNSTLQNFMFTMLNDNNTKAVKMSLNIMIELYKKNIWNDAKTANVIGQACFSKITKVMVAAIKFFLTTEEPEKDSDDSDSEDEVTVKDVLMANKFNKKTRKREKQLQKAKQLVQKSKKKKAAKFSSDFSALHLIYDPQGMAEKLFSQLESRHERFEVKVMTLDLISRLIGVHQLILFSFYPYIQRFLQPHQREVTRLLQFAAQASHELVPPEVLEPVLKTLVNNFVTERNSSDVMAIGLNAVRELCARCPLAMSKELLGDLVQYRGYRNKSVMMAARSLVQLYRINIPELLHRRDRGRPTEASVEIKAKKFGELVPAESVPGAEVLTEENEDGPLAASDDDSSDEEWQDVVHSSDEADGNSDNGCSEEEKDDDDDENEVEDADEDSKEDEKDAEKEESVKEKASKVSMFRVLTDEDFKKIEAAQLAKAMAPARKGTKRKAEESVQTKGELVALGDIENIYKKKKNSKEERIAAVRKGQEGREKFGWKDGRQNPFSSKTNREKRKNKNFMMIKHKVRAKVKRSFKDKQIALRDHLIKLKKMK